MHVDHVVWGVADLDRAAAEVESTYGLASVPGGRHPGWGTANRIIPLGPPPGAGAAPRPTYLELMAVVDPGEAAADPAGRGLARHIRAWAGLMLWCVATDDLDAVAARLGLDVEAKERVRPDGTRIGWRFAGLGVALDNPSLPFFIEWAIAPGDHPGLGRAGHAVAPLGIAGVTVGADPDELAAWLGGEALPVRCDGPPGVNSVTVATATGELAIP